MLSLKHQALLISLWISDEKTFSKTNTLVRPEYFDPELRKTIKFVKSYYNEYNGIPSVDIIDAETGILPKLVKMSKDQCSYTEEQIETFCRQSALKKIIMEQSPELIKSENFDQLEHLIREAVSMKIDSDIGISFFRNIEERQNAMDFTHRYSTGYPELDKHMDGGPARCEMMLVLAISGGGKSVAMLNFGVNLIKQRDVNTNKFLNCLYISLELPESMIDKRTQMVVTRRSSNDIKNHPDEVRADLEQLEGKRGELGIKFMRLGSTANDIRALIKEIEQQQNWTPDVVILDYLDKLHPIQKVSTENIGTRDKFITEEFYDLLNEYQLIGLTASQLVKSAATVEVYDQSHQAGGAEKMRSTDWGLAIHLTDAMRAAGQIGFQLLKTRSSDGVGNTVMLGWDAKSLCINNTSDRRSGFTNRTQPTTVIQQTRPCDMDDLMNMI